MFDVFQFDIATGGGGGGGEGGGVKKEKQNLKVGGTQLLQKCPAYSLLTLILTSSVS